MGRVVSRRSWYEGVYMILSEPGDVHRRSCIVRSPLLLPQSFCPSSVFYPTKKQMRVVLSSHPPSLPFSSLRIRPSSQSVQREPPRALQMHGFSQIRNVHTIPSDGKSDVQACVSECMLL